MAASPSEPDTGPSSGPWAPLGVPMFRRLWLAILVSNIGTGIQEVAAAWVMAEATPSPLLVAAVQSATTLPVLLLALAAGTLADLVDRRRYLIAAQCVALFGAALATALALTGRLGPASLLACVFIGGVGAALALPAQAATTPELVPRPLLPAAVSLGSLGINIARSVGPALGGLVVAVLGAAWAFGLNALSFLGVIAVLWAWRRDPGTSALPPERFASALRAGLRYAWHAPPFRAVLLRAAGFFAFASAYTALLPLLARGPLGLGPGGYGALLATVGLGAILGALVLPRVRPRVGGDALVLGASLAYAGAIGALAIAPRPAVALAASFVAGTAWISVLASLQVAAQTRVPPWVRARALSIYLLVFSGGMALGSLVWGALAQWGGLQLSLLVAAAGLAVASLLTVHLRIAGRDPDVMPSAHWPQPVVSEPIDGERGPVLVTIEYDVPATNLREVLSLLDELGRRRRRDGALHWGAYEDAARPGIVLEAFVDASWLDHLRLHQRVTGEERTLQERIAALLVPGSAPRVRHYVGAAPGQAIAADPGIAHEPLPGRHAP